MIKFLLASVAAFFITSAATAGSFTVTGEDSQAIDVLYYGDVYRFDYLKWNEIVTAAEGRVIILTIETYGGSAYGGADLYWAIEQTPRVITKAGTVYGAWSAGALMWMAGDHRIVPEGATVGWHRAFCNWDPMPFPDIGCDVSDFDVEMMYIFLDAGYSVKFGSALIQIQTEFGTDGWIEVTSEGWFVADDSTSFRAPVAPVGLGVAPEDWEVH